MCIFHRRGDLALRVVLRAVRVLVVSAFRASSLSRNARTMLVAYSLTMETFLLIYCTFSYMRTNVINLAFSISFSAYAVVFLMYSLPIFFKHEYTFA
jgi:hypothetical protein